jgi:coenzyme F420 biosynthesis associated uncharacterized protein
MSANLVDWDLAVRTARRLVKPGPAVSPQEAAAVVEELRSLAAQAQGHVRAYTGLAADDDSSVSVVDRPGWVQANVDGFRLVLEPLLDRLAAKRTGPTAGAVVTAVGSRVTGVQVGTILAYLASRVLGQYELFLPPGQGPGRLTLVAPNILATERQLDVDPHDFRLWVCLHEETHRTQFTGVPWLREHVRAEMTAYINASDLDPAAVWARLRTASNAVGDALRGRGSVSLLEAVQTPEQLRVLDRLTGVMSLLEGHGDVVMDGVGPDVVPTVAEIRRRFERRRQANGPVDRAIRRLFGIDLKMAQYAEGARFVRTVVDAVGMTRFNTVWTSPATLPDKAEIRDPAAWMERVLGVRPAVSA